MGIYGSKEGSQAEPSSNEGEIYPFTIQRCSENPGKESVRVAVVEVHGKKLEYYFYFSGKGEPRASATGGFTRLSYEMRKAIRAAINKEFNYATLKERTLESTLDANGNVIRVGDFVTYWVNGKREGGMQEMSGHNNWRVESIARTGKELDRVQVIISNIGYTWHRKVTPDKIVKQEGKIS